MPPLHALEDEIVAGLQRQMQMRHQSAVLRQRIEQVAVGLDGIDRRQPQPLQLRHVLEDLLDQRAEFWRARQIGAIAGDVDAGQHDLAITVADEPAHVIDHRAHRHRARIAAAIRNDAERAAMVAAVLHLDEGAGAA